MHRTPSIHARSLLLLLVLGLAAPARADEAKRPAAPPITRVVVFADRAETTRAGQAPCQNGRAALTFPGLPTTIDTRTLRPEASGKARPIGTAHRQVTLREERNERAAALEREVLVVRDELQRIGDRLEVLDERETRTAGYGSYFVLLGSEELRSERPDPARWGAVLDTLAGDVLAGRRQAATLRQEQRAAQRKLDVLQRQLAALGGAGVHEELEVVVTAECNGEPQPRLSLSYVVPGATWRPEYDLRFSADRGAKTGPGKAELTVAAVVQQASGEDWEGVTLVLSTARPKLGAQAPYPAPLKVHGRKAGEDKVLVDALERREKLSGPASATVAGPEAAVLEDRGQSFVLTLPHKATVRADGRPYWLPVDVTTTPAEAKLVTVPKLRAHVYQLAVLKNPARYPLLAGTLHAYRGGSYVGDVQLEHKAPGEALEISLGIDDEIRVERKEVKDRDRQAGLLSSTKRLERAYRVRTTNNATGPVQLEVRDNLPVSKTEEVKVELDRSKTTPGFSLDGHRGFITWTLQLPPRVETVVDLAYTIKLPEDWQVQLR